MVCPLCFTYETSCIELQILFVACYDLIRKGAAIMTDMIRKDELLKRLDMERDKWKAIKGREQDVTQENFIDNIILIYEWVISDIERM